MIDTFWTKWRVRRLCRGDAALIGRWLDDYAGWLYGRLWVQLAQDSVVAQRLLTEIFSRAAGRIQQWLKQPCPMSEWLIQQIPSDISKPAAFSYTPETTRQIKLLWTQSLSDEAGLLPEVIQAGQRALALLGRDDQEIMICRYLRMETLSETASNCGRTVAEMEGLLYRARHSFRRTLEGLVSVPTALPQSVSLASQDVLDANLEKFFHSFGPKPAYDRQVFEPLRSAIAQILSQPRNQPGSVIRKLGRWGLASAAIAAAGGLWCVIDMSRSNLQNPPQPEGSNTPPRAEKLISEQPPGQTVNVELQLKQVFELGEQQDIDGLIVLVQNGSYPAQLAAAHYLARIGDKSAIDPLDRAAQKWYPGTPSETNPFVEAISAIEARMAEQKQREELERRKQIILDTALPLIRERLKKTEPNAASREPNEPNIQQPVPAHTEVLKAEPNIPQSEPNEPNVPAAGNTEPNIAAADANSAVYHTPAN